MAAVGPARGDARPPKDMTCFSLEGLRPRRPILSHPSILRLKLGRQRGVRFELVGFPAELVAKMRLQGMQKKPLRPEGFGESTIQSEIAVRLVADDRHVALGALHAQLMAAAGLRLQLDE